MTKLILLTKGQHTIVDDADYEYLNQWKWFMGTRYAQRAVWLPIERRQITLSMHRVIVNAPQGMHVDHIDRNELNNTRANLRVCTVRENLGNQKRNKRRAAITSQFKGVCWHNQLNKWLVRINNKHIGVFHSEIDAALAYDEAARKHFGEFAALNFPLEHERAA